MKPSTKALIAGMIAWFLASCAIEPAFESGDFRFLILFSLLGVVSFLVSIIHEWFERTIEEA